MAPNNRKDPWNNARGADLFGSKARIVQPSDTLDLDPYAKAIVVVAAGDLAYLPADNADGSIVNVVGAPVGFIPPHRVRRIMATGTDASVVTVDDE